ncbi:MAG: TonB-dependent receptor [Alphaproteobacteria bacterium]|nr:TonB-dependent receptor [Alphaproteobacteria bacterium]
MPFLAHRAGRPLAAVATVILVTTTAAWSQDAPVSVLPDIEVIGTTPLLGTGTPINKVPGNPQTLSEDAIERYPSNQLIDQLHSQLNSVTVVDVQNSTYQKDIRYRGFAASPLLGESQGIAVFQNGVRINEAFGDTVQWDLIPEPAIRSMNLVNNNPAFGLNALGGAIAIDMHDGFSFQGMEAEAHGGYWERWGTEMQAGWANENFAAYVAADRQNDGGWRNESQSELSRLYSDVAMAGDEFQINFNFTYADTDLIGNGPAPAELLAANRRAVFTTPDTTENEIFFFQGNGSYDVSDIASVQANAYFRRITRSTLNGDEIAGEQCDRGVLLATFAADGNLAGTVGNGGAVTLNPENYLCVEEDDPTLLIDQNGNAIAASAATPGAENTTSTQTMTYGGAIQEVIEDALFGLDNTFIFGTALDFSQTRFHNEQHVGSINLARAIVNTGSPILNVQGYTSAAAGGSLVAGEATPTQIKNTTASLGIYATDTLDVTDALSVMLAGRFNRTSSDTSDEFVYDAVRAGSLQSSSIFSRFNPAVGFTYAVEPLNSTVYGSAGENTRAPTPAELGCADPNAPCRFPNAFLSDPPLDQVVSRTFEAGARGAIPGLPNDLDVNWNFSVYTTTNFDDILFVSGGTGLGAGFFKNVGNTRRRGIEAGANGRWDRLGFYANYGFIEATFESEFTVASTNHPLAASLGGGQSIPVSKGDNIPGVPDHTLNLGVDYALTEDWVLGGTMVTRSGVYLRGDEGNLLPRTNGYTVFNTHTTYVLSDYVEVFGRIENLFDSNYETFGVLGEIGNDTPIYELPNGITNPRYLSPGQPFAAYVGVRIRLN